MGTNDFAGIAKSDGLFIDAEAPHQLEAQVESNLPGDRVRRHRYGGWSSGSLRHVWLPSCRKLGVCLGYVPRDAARGVVIVVR